MTKPALTECPWCGSIQRTPLSRHYTKCTKKPRDMVQLPKDSGGSIMSDSYKKFIESKK